jgi:hypothetical protein
VDRSNQFDYALMGNSASFVDLDGDRLPDIVAPDGAGIFWFWKNIGSPGNPQFGLGDVMPLLVDNERSTYGILPGSEAAEVLQSDAAKQQKAEIDARRSAELERLQRRSEQNPSETQWDEEDLKEWIAAKFPYPWEEEQVATGNTFCLLNGFRQLRAVAAPFDWDRNGTVDFIVGDAQGNIYTALNIGNRTAPHFRTYTKSRDTLTLKLVLSYNPIERKNEYRAQQFLNYAVPYVVDWNGNGTPDLLVGEGTYSTNSVRLFLDPQTADPAAGRFPEERVLVVGEERTFLAPSAWDWDGDGFPDLLVADAEGGISVHPNPQGRYRNATVEMTEFQMLRFEEDEPLLRRFTVPQPCDWNADGVMDLIWSGPFGRIFYALGTERGSVEFGPPIPVRSTLADRVRRFPVPYHTGMAAVPAYGNRRVGKGGTADARRYFTARSRGVENQDGWPKPNPWYGLIPGWDPDEAFLSYQQNLANGPFRDDRFYRAGTTPSYAIAPVPYEIFGLVEESASREKGSGDYTLLQTWHDPRSNQVFRQPRNQMTRFGQAVSLSFPSARLPKLDRKNLSDAKREAWIKENLHNGNVRTSFYMKLEGDFSRLTVGYGSRNWYREKLNIGDGGQIQFKTIENPPIGRWFHYQSIAGPSDQPRAPGSLAIHLYGRGEVRIRDVAIADTFRPPDQ